MFDGIWVDFSVWPATYLGRIFYGFVDSPGPGRVGKNLAPRPALSSQIQKPTPRKSHFFRPAGCPDDLAEPYV
jgi:hypothetical protein